MKRFLICGSAFCALMVAVCVASAAPTNFAGTWELDKSKSQLTGQMANVESLTWTITQDEKQLTVESKTVAGGQERPARKTSYNLDGSETTQELTGRMTGKATMKAKWQGDGKILELNTVSKMTFQDNEVTTTSQEHWELAEGGKVLKVHRVSESPRGKQESQMVFNKK